MLAAAASRTYFPSENWVSVWKEYVLQTNVFKVDDSSFCSKLTYSAVLKKHMSLWKKSSMLEAEASSTLFACENRVSFWKEKFLQIGIYKMETGSVCSK
jgi:hypothetical protein